jgi:hypothetical protein
VEVGPGRPDALVDSEDGVVVHGAQPGGEVVLEARVELGALGWTCRGVFRADAGGDVDTSRDPSAGGDYTGVDPFGLFWSAHPAGPSRQVPARAAARARHRDECRRPRGGVVRAHLDAT